MSKQYPGGLITKTPVTPTSLSASGIWSLSDQAKAQATNTWPFPRDPQFNYVTMLLHGDGSAGAVPTTGAGAGTSATVTNFNADASTNNFNVAINGDTRSDNFTPYQGNGYYGVSFNGSSDYLTTPQTTSLNIGTGTFTVEVWVYLNSKYSSGGTSIINLGSGANGGGPYTGWGLIIDYDAGSSTAYPAWYRYDGSVTQYTSSTSLNTGQWYHLAVARDSSNNVAIWVNGSRTYSGTSTVSFNNVNSDPLTVGRRTNGSGSSPNWLNGYLSNGRVVIGSNVYNPTQSTITVPTSPLTAVTNTQLLFLQSNTFVDNSSAARTITVAGGAPAISSGQPFTLPTTVATYGSGYFDGTGDYLLSPSNSAFAFSGNFTVEAWIYLTALPSGANAMYVTDFRSGATTNFTFGVIDSGGATKTYMYVNGGTASATGSTTLAKNVWYHIAYVRSGTTVTCYLNGVSDATMTSSLSQGTTAVTIGARYTGTTEYVNGYISDLRAVNGTAVYTTTFTPPTSPLTAITNTSLLTTQYNGGGNNSGFKDSSQFNFPITRYGNTTQGTFTPYGANWSNYFDGDGDGITTAVSAGFAFGTGDFTYEGWYYSLDTGSSQRGMFDTRVTSSSTAGVLMREDSSGFLVYINGGTLFTASGRVANTWQHIALVRQSGTIRLYVNGVQANSASSSQNFTDPNCRISGFIDTQATPYGYLGYISNARVVKGTCLYPSGTTFTPSITPLTAISGTSLLTCQGNRFFDASSNALTITVNGNTTVQRFSPFAPLTVYNPATNGGSGYFDGSGDYLSAGDQTAFEFGAGEFTISAWVYLTSFASTCTIASKYVGGDVANSEFVLWVTTGGNIGIALDGGGGEDYVASSAGAVTLNQWQHIVASKSGTTVRLFQNGTQVASGTSSRTLNSTGTALTIGGIGSGSLLTGYISGLCIQKGTGYSSVTVPTAPISAPTNTSLLLGFTNAGILDNSMMNDLETVGNAAVSTSVKKYGAASMVFDGTGDALYSTSQSVTFGTGDFTIEFWIYFNAVNNSTVKFVYDMRNSGATSAAFFAQETDNSWSIYNGSGTLMNLGIGGSTFTASTWTHVAICRSSGVTKGFINGTQTGSATDTSSYSTSTLTIAARYTQDNATNCYLDDLRITKYARYTASFTAPTQAFPNG